MIGYVAWLDIATDSTGAKAICSNQGSSIMTFAMVFSMRFYDLDIDAKMYYFHCFAFYSER